MKCLNCQDGKLVLVQFRKAGSMNRRVKDRGVMECKSCGHRELFG